MTLLRIDREARAIGHASGSAGFRQLTLALFAAGLATFASMYSAQAVLPSLSAEFAVSPAVAALAVSATTGVLALAIIPVSVLSERFGRTRVMIVSAALSSGIGLLLPLSQSIEVLLIGRALQGAALAGVPAVAMAYLAEEVDGGSLGAAMGRYIAGTTIGGLAGRVLSSAVLDVSSWRWAMESAAALSLVCALMLTWRLPASRSFVPRRVGFWIVLRSLSGHLASPVLRALFGLGFVLTGGFVAVYNFLAFRLTSAPFLLPEAAVGLVFLLYLGGTVSAPGAGRAADRFGRRTVLAVSVLVTALGLVVTLSTAITVVLVGMLLFTGGFFAAHSIASGWVGALAHEHRAQASALYLCAYYLGSSVAGAGAGLAFAHGGWTPTVAYVMALLAVAGVIVAVLWRVVD